MKCCLTRNRLRNHIWLDVQQAIKTIQYFEQLQLWITETLTLELNRHPFNNKYVYKLKRIFCECNNKITINKIKRERNIFLLKLKPRLAISDQSLRLLLFLMQLQLLTMDVILPPGPIGNKEKACFSITLMFLVKMSYLDNSFFTSDHQTFVSTTGQAAISLCLKV